MRFDNETVERWSEKVTEYLNRWGYNCLDVKLGVEAWDIAHFVGITEEAYQDRKVTDAHIKTVLQKIFPNAIFQDRYYY